MKRSCVLLILCHTYDCRANPYTLRYKPTSVYMIRRNLEQREIYIRNERLKVLSQVLEVLGIMKDSSLNPFTKTENTHPRFINARLLSIH